MAIQGGYSNWLLGCAAATLAASLLFLALAPSRYTATVRIQIDPDLDETHQIGVEGGRPALDDAILQQVGSPEVIGPTVDRFRLSRRGESPARDEDRRDAAIQAIRSRLRVESTSTPAVWLVKYSSDRPTTTAAVLGDLTTRAATANGAVDDQTRSAQRLMLNAIHDGVANTSAALAGVQAASSELGARKAAGEAQIAALQAQLSPTKANRKPGPAAPSARAGGASADTGLDPNDLRNQRAALAARQADLARRYGPRYPLMVDLDQQLKQLDILIDAQRRLDSASARLTGAASAQAVGLRKLLAGARDLAASDADETAHLAPLVQQLQGALTSYQTILDQYVKTAPPEALRLRVLAPPSTAPRRDPSTARDVATALALLAAIVAVGALAARARRSRGFETEDDVERRLGLPVMAIIPRFAPSGGGRNDGLAADRPVDGLIRGSDPAFMQAFQTLQRAFDVKSAQPKPLTISVCSALSDEGKTTVSACLARACAQSGTRVVLIDCDGRQHALSELFAGAGGPGLVQLLRDGAELDQAMSPDPATGLRVIRYSSNEEVHDLSTPAVLRALLDRLRGRFDLVILDTGPVLALADARIIAALADEVLLVVRWRRTPAKAAQLALRVLGKARVKGVALTLAEAA